MNYKWTEDRIQILKKNYKTASWEQLFELLNTTNKNTIIHKASELKITRLSPLTEDDKQFILNNYTKLSLRKLAKEINKSSSTVLRFLNKNGLHTIHEYSLREEDVKLFIEIYPKYTNKYLSKKIFTYLTCSQLRTQAKRFNLVKNKDKNIKWYDKEQMLEDLEFCIKKYGHVPMISELQLWGLPSDKTWVRYFGGLTEACNLIGITRPNYSKLITGDYCLYDKLGNICLSQTELLISNFLIEQNIYFEKEVLYNTVIPFDECRKKRFDWKIGDCYIEYFGLLHYKNYDQTALDKINLCSKYNIKLLALYPKDIQNTSWQNKILNFLNKK